MFDDMPPLFDVFAKVTQKLFPDEELQGIADHVIAKIKNAIGDHELTKIPALLVIVRIDSKKKCLEVEAHDARADGMDDLLKHVIPDLARATAKELKAKTPIAAFFVSEALIAYKNAASDHLKPSEAAKKLEAEPDQYRNLSITGLTIDKRLLVIMCRSTWNKAGSVTTRTRNIKRLISNRINPCRCLTSFGKRLKLPLRK